jgi:hypothetical protein
VTDDLVNRARELVQAMPSASEAALRSAEGLLRGRIVCVTHEIMYLLHARDLFVKEHEILLSRIEDSSNQIDLTV